MHNFPGLPLANLEDIFPNCRCLRGRGGGGGGRCAGQPMDSGGQRRFELLSISCGHRGGGGGSRRVVGRWGGAGGCSAAAVVGGAAGTFALLLASGTRQGRRPLDWWLLREGEEVYLGLI